MKKLDFDSVDLKICQEIMRKAGKTYYFAVQIFPKEMRLATYALYAFYRVPDDIVDLNEDLSPQIKEKMLQEWIDKWNHCINNNGESDEAVLRAAYIVHKNFDIDFSYAQVFLDAMKQDLVKSRYENYAQLENYMYGSAAVVGIMMTHIIGVKSKKKPNAVVLGYAEKLGYAMQLTNFIRDICEDIDERNRIYMPEDEYKSFGIDELDFAKHKYTENWSNFLELQLHRAERFYREADQGIKYLNWQGRLSVKVASRLYESYHRLVRNSNYKVYHNKYSVSGLRKIYILVKSIFI